MAEYEPVRQQLATMLTPKMFGDPAATSDAIFRAVDADEPRLHLVLGPLAARRFAKITRAVWPLGDVGSGIERRTGLASVMKNPIKMRSS